MPFCIRPEWLRWIVLTETRQAIVAPAFFAVNGLHLFLGLDDQVVFERTLDRPIEGARPHSHRAIRLRFNFSHDGIAVFCAIGESQQDVKNGWSEWKQRLWNEDKQAKKGRRNMGITDEAWDGAASRWPDTPAYCDSCLINLNEGPRDEWIEANCKLPVREPDGDVNRHAVHSAWASLEGARRELEAPPEAKKAAARKLVTLYNQIQEEAPPRLKQMAE